MIKAINATRKPHTCAGCFKPIAPGSQAWLDEDFHAVDLRADDVVGVPDAKPERFVFTTRSYYHRACARPREFVGAFKETVPAAAAVAAVVAPLPVPSPTLAVAASLAESEKL